MPAERSLCDNVLEMADLVNHIELVASQKCESFYVSFGMNKSAAGHKAYTAILVCQLNQSPDKHKGMNKREFFQGTSVRNLLEQVNDFFKTI